MYKQYFYGASGTRSVAHLVVRWDACGAPKFVSDEFSTGRKFSRRFRAPNHWELIYRW